MKLILDDPSIEPDCMPRSSALSYTDGHLQFSSVGQLWEVKERQWLRVREPTRDQIIRLLVGRFLSWQLPESVRSDLCVTMNDYAHTRSGTNLLTADEARQMLEHILG